VSCPSGTHAVGGGYDASGSNVIVFRSVPTANGDGWQVNARATTNTTVTIAAYAICGNTQ